MADILAEIAAYKREEVAALRPRASALIDAAAAQSPALGFERALRDAPSIALIAEIKKASPSKGLIRADFNPATIARAYQEGGATCLSCLTDGPSFQGSEAAFREARTACTLPMLRKDFMVDPLQVVEARAMGADAILVILAMTDDGLNAELMAAAAEMGMDALVETHDAAEIDRAIALGATLVGINNRDLRTFHTTLDTFTTLAARLPDTAVRVAESGIFTPADVVRVERDGADAILVGESLMRQADVAQATRSLLDPNSEQP